MNKPAKDTEGASMFPVAADGRYCTDNESHYIETWQAMEELVEAGLIKSIGLSNFTITQIKEVVTIARIKPTVLQNECHPYLQQQDLVDFCKREVRYNDC